MCSLRQVQLGRAPRPSFQPVLPPIAPPCTPIHLRADGEEQTEACASAYNAVSLVNTEMPAGTMPLNWLEMSELHSALHRRKQMAHTTRGRRRTQRRASSTP
jgi:hypothetical protein